MYMIFWKDIYDVFRRQPEWLREVPTARFLLDVAVFTLLYKCKKRIENKMGNDLNTLLA